MKLAALFPSLFLVAAAATTAFFMQPAFAQSSYSSATPGTEGSAFSNGPTNWQAGEAMGIVPAAPVGQTFPTYDKTLGTGGLGPISAPTFTGGLANNSVNQAPVDSGYYSFGFSPGPNSVATDPYVPPGLPPVTSTGSVDLNTADCPYCGQGVSIIFGW